MKIVLFGSGNVAWNLANILSVKGHKIVQIVGRNYDQTEKLASIYNCDFTTNIDSVNNNADLYVIAVNDDSIATIVNSVNFNSKLVVHTSGSVSVNVFKSRAANYGVLYPLQTFSKNKMVEFADIPICIEANNESNLHILSKLANQISNSIYEINSAQREILHLSAVFASNFVNHMYAISSKLLNDNNLYMEMLLPLIKETYLKITKFTALECQTGPAKRNDKIILDKHIDLLKNNPEIQTIYKIITNHIIEIGKINNDDKE